MTPPSTKTDTPPYSIKLGDLVSVQAGKTNAIGIVVEIFDDLSKPDPWVRIRFTHPHHSYQWCKYQALTIVSKEKESQNDPPSPSVNPSGSL
tara:strand:+ start:1764 stop:2039 length:276 start_codon:yes stop_codon:yes gene_type:complete